MILDFFRSINWIDVAMASVLVRAVFIGLRRGFVDEFFQLIAVAAAVFVIFHYYPSISHFVQARTPLKPGMANVLAYLFLWSIIAFLAKLVRDGLRIFIKVETISPIHKAGGLVLCVIRGVLLASLVVWMLYVTESRYIQRNITESLSKARFARAGSTFYQAVFDHLIIKLFPEEKLNREVILQRGDFPSSRYE